MSLSQTTIDTDLRSIALNARWSEGHGVAGDGDWAGRWIRRLRANVVIAAGMGVARRSA